MLFTNKLLNWFWYISFFVFVFLFVFDSFWTFCYNNFSHINAKIGFGQLNQSSSLSSSLNSGLNSGINLGSAMGAGSYQHYGLNALGRLSTKQSMRQLKP